MSKSRRTGPRADSSGAREAGFQVPRDGQQTQSPNSPSGSPNPLVFAAAATTERQRVSIYLQTQNAHL